MDFLYNAKYQVLHQIEKYRDLNLPEQNPFLLSVSQPGPEKPSIKAPWFSFAQRKNENRKEKEEQYFHKSLDCHWRGLFLRKPDLRFRQYFNSSAPCCIEPELQRRIRHES